MVEVNEFKGHSPVLSNVGVFILLFGWFSFNASSTHGASNCEFELSGRAAVNTMLSSATAALVGFGYHQVRTGVHDLWVVHCHLLSGCVAITGCCAYVDLWAASLIGAFSSLFYMTFSSLMLSFHIDDPLDAFAVHGGAGIWGTIAVGLFSRPDLVNSGRYGGAIYGGDFRLLGAQILGLLLIFAWGGVIFALVIRCMDRVPFLNLRVCVDSELLGLDFAYHEGFAYPDFNRQIICHDRVKQAEQRIVKRYKGRKLKKPRMAVDYLMRAQRRKQKTYESAQENNSFRNNDEMSYEIPVSSPTINPGGVNGRGKTVNNALQNRVEGQNESGDFNSLSSGRLPATHSMRKPEGEEVPHQQPESSSTSGDDDDLAGMLKRYSISLDPVEEKPYYNRNSHGRNDETFYNGISRSCSLTQGFSMSSPHSETAQTEGDVAPQHQGQVSFLGTPASAL